MNVNFIEGVLDKSESGLRAILLAQLRVRVGVAIPVIVADLVLFLTSPNGLPLWFLGLTAGYCLYALSPYSLIRNGSFKVLYGLLSPRPYSIRSCCRLDRPDRPVRRPDRRVLSVHDARFRFRTGRPLMHLCQIASIAGFSLVLAFNDTGSSTRLLGCAARADHRRADVRGQVDHDLREARDMPSRKAAASPTAGQGQP
jgi:hypothetical protein